MPAECLSRICKPNEKAVALIVGGKGTYFDPDVIDGFVELQDEFRAIAKRHADSDHDIVKKAENLSSAVADAP
jgi:putative two-component system response regulator